MKIIDVSAFEVIGRLTKPWKIATATMDALTAVVVRVTTDDGTVGYGEACTRKGAGVARAVVEEILRPVLVGREAGDIDALWDEMVATLRTRGHTRGFLFEAISGVDIALWDIMGQVHEQPINKMLFGQGRTHLPAYASSILIDTPDRMADEATLLVESDGYSAIKVKIAGDVAEDIARISAIRSAIGRNVRIMLDANSGFDAADAAAFARRAEPYDIYWLEEPLVLDDLPSYRRLRAMTGVRIALGEGEFHTSGFRTFLEEGLVDIVQPNITRAGGFTGVRRIAALAQAFGVPIAPHTGASGPVCMAATLQLGAALSGFAIHEFMYLENPFQDYFETPLPQPKDGAIAVPQGPGIGVRPAANAIGAFAA